MYNDGGSAQSHPLQRLSAIIIHRTGIKNPKGTLKMSEGITKEAVSEAVSAPAAGAVPETGKEKEEKKVRKKQHPDRMSGILVHPTSFPSPYGIGDLGKGAFDFIDFLYETAQSLWQVLPLGPTGNGDSPYQGPSAFAGQTLIISPDELKKIGLLTDEDLKDIPKWNNRRVDYGAVIQYKEKLFRIAFGRFHHTPDAGLLDDFDAFCDTQQYWLDDYCLFMALKKENGGKCWLDWDKKFRSPTPAVKKECRKRLADEIEYYAFLQFMFERQWVNVREYAHEYGIKIIGDAPIFMSLDSCDVWANKKYFQLDSTGHPLNVAGVPPDYFSATGQLWGNPLYDWDAQKEDGYKWWILRVKRQLELVDYLRIDHFRGFDAYWSVPAGEETAINGQWVDGPQQDLFLALQKALGRDLPIFAEDLGVITPEVEQLRDMFGFPGMKVLQFGFGDMNDTTYIPHFYTTPNCICYTGTHDNDTTMGWYEKQPEIVKDRIRCIGNTGGDRISWDFIRFAFASIAKYAIFPMQDLRYLGNEDRMNTPGVAAANWCFRYTKDMLSEEDAKWLRKTTELYDRD